MKTKAQALTDDSLIDMRFMFGDSSFTDRYFRNLIKLGKIPSLN